MRAVRLLIILVSACSLFAAVPKPQKAAQEIVAPFWTLEPGWHTSLEIRNNTASDVIAVTPILRTDEGREIELPPVSLQPDGLGRLIFRNWWTRSKSEFLGIRLAL